MLAHHTRWEYDEAMTLDKTRTYSPKEALDADPNWKTPVKLGRGRMPTGGDAHCRDLAAKGFRIKGYEVSVSSTPATAKTPAAPVVNKVAVSNDRIIRDFVIVYDEKKYKAIGPGNKEWGMREVCNNCRVSLVQNHCDNPTILGNIPVKIVPRD